MKNISQLTSAISKNATLSSAVLTTLSENDPIDILIKEFGPIQDYLDSKPGSKDELNFKRIFLKSLFVAKKRGVCPIALPESPVEMASTIDDALTRVKTAYNVGTENLYPEKAVNGVVDRMTSRLCVVAEKFIDKGATVITPVATKVLSKIYPPLTFVAPMVHHVVKILTPPVKKVIIAGINTVASCAKSIIKETFKSVVNKGKTIFKTLFS